MKTQLEIEIANKPFMRLAVLFIVGVIIAEQINISQWVAIWTTVLFLTCSIFFRSYNLRLFFISAALISIGITSAKIKSPHETIPRSERLMVNCVVTDNVSERGRWQRTTAHVEAFSGYDDSTIVWQPSDENVILFADTSARIELGERLTILAYVNNLDTISNQSGYAKTMRSRGLTGKIFITEGRLLEKEVAQNQNLWQRIIKKSKETQAYLTDKFAQLDMSESDLAVASALIAGDKSDLSGEIKESYSKTGVSHILAISGLHLGIIFLFLNILLSPLVIVRGGHIVRSLVIVLLLWGYAFVTGLSPSVLRAAFMLSVMQISMLTFWRYNSYNALFASAFVLIVINPYYIYDLSFQMSYLALISILFFYSRFCRWFGVRRLSMRIAKIADSHKGFVKILILTVKTIVDFITKSTMIGIAAQIGVIPLIIYVFGRFSMINFLINPLIMFLVAIVMGLGFLYLLFSFLPGVGFLFEKMLSFQNWIVETAAENKFASVENIGFSENLLFSIYFLIFVTMILIKYSEYQKSIKSINR